MLPVGGPTTEGDTIDRVRKIVFVLSTNEVDHVILTVLGMDMVSRHAFKRRSRGSPV
jgi:hypothetical protein